MRVFIFVLACFTFPGHARRMQMKRGSAPSEFEGRADSQGHALAKLLTALKPAAGFQLGGGVHNPVGNKLVSNYIKSPSAVTSRSSAAPIMEMSEEMSSAASIGALVAGLVSGFGIVWYTERAGMANEEDENDQECVDCNGRKVTRCVTCSGTGSFEGADRIREARIAAGKGDESQTVAIVEDWAEGPQQVKLFEDVFVNWPVKVTENICPACDGRGVRICESCEGTGIQPRFLERFSPEDFMD